MHACETMILSSLEEKQNATNHIQLNLHPDRKKGGKNNKG